MFDECWIFAEKMKRNVVKKMLRWGHWNLWTVRKSAPGDEAKRLLHFGRTGLTFVDSQRWWEKGPAETKASRRQWCNIGCVVVEVTVGIRMLGDALYAERSRFYMSCQRLAV